MGKRNVRRPTEDIAIARVMARKDTSPSGDPVLLQKVIMDDGDTKWLVFCFHSTINISISYLWNRYQRRGECEHIIDFLMRRGAIYKYQKVS